MLPKQVDIIVPSYLNEQFTIACFRNVKKNTDPCDYRIVWVDNGSPDRSAVLDELCGTDYIHIQFASNQGFVAAVNEGLRQSTGRMVCLLNNDTIVSSGWLEKLKAALLSNDGLGIVGPLTDYCRIPGGGPTSMDSHHSLTLHNSLLPPEAIHWDLEKINRELESRYSGRTQPISFVAFLCALIKREVLNTVGLLDPNYAMGMYDDNDYNIAARRAGFRCELAIDTCIYHRGRTTFTVVEEREGLNVRQLLARNKAYMDNKWGKRAQT
jgi:GT2 family glycosyltransferase